MMDGHGADHMLAGERAAEVAGERLLAAVGDIGDDLAGDVGEERAVGDAVVGEEDGALGIGDEDDDILVVFGEGGDDEGELLAAEVDILIEIGGLALAEAGFEGRGEGIGGAGDDIGLGLAGIGLGHAVEDDAEDTEGEGDDDHEGGDIFGKEASEHADSFLLLYMQHYTTMRKKMQEGRKNLKKILTNGGGYVIID